jgi:hypothetical protein
MCAFFCVVLDWRRADPASRSPTKRNYIRRATQDTGRRKARPRFTPGKGPPGTHWTGGWVGSRADLNTEARGKILCSCRGTNLDCPVVQTVARHYTD